MTGITLFLLIQTERPVIQLEDVVIEGQVRRPPIVEMKDSKLNETLEEMALKNLIRLEKKLLEPRKP